MSELRPLNVKDYLREHNTKLVERLEDSDGWRWYCLPEDKDKPENWLASVTNILSVVTHERLKKYYQTTSVKKQGEDLEFSSNLGTRIHELLEADLQGRDVSQLPLTDEEWAYVTPLYERWLHMRQEHGIEATVLEVPVFSFQYGYAGTLDMLGYFDGAQSLMDFKSGFYSIKTGWQMAAYRNAYTEMIPSGRDLGMVGLSVPWNRTANAFKYEHYDFCLNRFLDCLGAFRGLYYRKLEKMGWKYLHVEREVPLSERSSPVFAEVAA